jgi:hypothetical protein
VLLSSPAFAQDGTAAIHVNARLSYQRTNSFPTDTLGTHLWGSPLPVEPFESRLRVGVEAHQRGFGLLVEADAFTGTIFGLPKDGLVADRTPHPTFKPLELRQLYAQYKGKTGVLRVGQQTSHWGLGLLANAGAKDPEPGDFGEQRFGTIVYRAMVAGRPLYELGGFFRAIEPILAVDMVVRDSTAEINRGDRAFQGTAALRFAQDAEHHVGLYAVYRHQRAIGVRDDARATDVIVLDVSGRWEWRVRNDHLFSLAFEVAGITGTTSQGRNDVAQVFQVRQVGALVKAGWRIGRTQLLLDWGYASGDRNLNDDKLESFRFDRDLKVGLVLFEDVIGWQSARSAHRASDPALLGQAPEGIELAPTGGAVTAAWYLFPRLKYGIYEWLDVYGGPLFAISTARLTDPFNSRVGGGTPINHLGGVPGNYLGTELDLGAQARWKLSELWQLGAALEVGLLFPGDAFDNAAGARMDSVGMVRARLALSL